MTSAVTSRPAAGGTRPYARERDVALAAARAAAEILRDCFARGVVPEWKGPGDAVTEADRTAEARVREIIADAFPDDAVVGEEGSADLAEESVGGRRRWYVDPLDGTINFTKGRTRWAVAVAFCDADDELAAAAIIRPLDGEELTATRGGGAWRGDDRLAVGDGVPPQQALLLVGPLHGGPAEHVQEAGSATLSLRVTGSTVSDLADLAVGTADVYLGNGQGRWDVAAGGLLCAEAGLVVTDLEGVPLTRPGHEILVGPPSVHAAVLRAIRA